MAAAHSQYLDNRSYAYRIAANGPQHAPIMMWLTAWNATVRVENATNYRYQKRDVAPYGFRVEQREMALPIWHPKRPHLADNESTPESLTRRVYADGTDKYWRYDGPERVAYERASVAQQGDRSFGIVDWVGQVQFYLRSGVRRRRQRERLHPTPGVARHDGEPNRGDRHRHSDWNTGQSHRGNHDGHGHRETAGDRDDERDDSYRHRMSLGRGTDQNENAHAGTGRLRAERRLV